MQVPLGILPKNENNSEEIVEIVSHLHQYVPVIEFEEEQPIHSSNEIVMVPKAVFSPVLLGGDQLTASRVRGAKKAKVSDNVPSNRFEGIIPVAEDWHTKMNFMGVCLFTIIVMSTLSTLLWHRFCGSIFIPSAQLENMEHCTSYGTCSIVAMLLRIQPKTLMHVKIFSSLQHPVW